MRFNSTKDSGAFHLSMNEKYRYHSVIYIFYFCDLYTLLCEG